MRSRHTSKARHRSAVQSAPIAVDTPAHKILAAVRNIPKGRVSTYGEIAKVAGLPRRARLVGTVLKQTPSSARVPWHRVINAAGRISFPAGSDAYVEQQSRLVAEGVDVRRGKVNLAQFGWPARDRELDEMLWKLP